MTHDYSGDKRIWGHDYTLTPISGGMKGRMVGWGRGINTDDFLILDNGKSTSRYRVDRISYFKDPSDMWSASVTFNPRAKEAKA